MKKNILLNKKEYEIIEDYKDCLNQEETENLLTEYFDRFDYVLGDYSYNRLRLKGFLNHNSKNVKNYNDIDNYKSYLKDFCANDCPYFLIKKQINVEKKQ